VRQWDAFVARLRSLVYRDRVETELDEEIRFHLEKEIEQRVREGLSPEEARHQSVLRFGAVQSLKEECRDARGLEFLDHFMRDSRHAIRRLARDWRFSALAVLIMALGIGVNTAIFSFVNSALFRTQPFQDPDRLVDIYQNAGPSSEPQATAYPVYKEMGRYSEVFTSVGAVAQGSVRYDDKDGAIRSGLVEYITSSYLTTVGLRPALGRWFTPEEDGAKPILVGLLGYHIWQTQFAADPGVVGRTIRVSGTPVAIIGVGPASLNSTLNVGLVTNLWLSVSSLPVLQTDYPPDTLTSPQRLTFMVKARLRGGAGVPQAQAAMDALAASLRLGPANGKAQPARIISVLGSVQIHPGVDPILTAVAAFLMAVVALLLAIALSNLTTLLLVRGVSRTKEFSVRLALGATRAQLVRHMLTENLLLAAAGGFMGCFLAWAGIRYLGTLDLPITFDVSLDYRVLAFAIATSLLAGILVGLGPALRTTRGTLNVNLRDEGAESFGRSRWLNLKNALVVFQVAASVVLLTVAGLLVRSVSNMRSDLGFATKTVALLETDAQYATASPVAAKGIYEELLRRIQSLPGVQSAALANSPPIEGFEGNRPLLFDGDPLTEGIPIYWTWAGPGYFETLQVPILYGRSLDSTDRPGATPVAVINETMARRFFGTSNAVGKSFRYESEPTTLVEIVGVVRDTNTAGPGDGPRPTFYRSTVQNSTPTPLVLIRFSGDATSQIPALIETLHQTDPRLPVLLAKTLDQHITDSWVAPAVAAGSMTGLGILGLALACLGLYAVVDFAVSRRTHEVAIRMALGALRKDVVWLVAREAVGLVSVGLVLGLAIAAAATQVLASVLVKVSTIDSVTFASVAVMMALVGMAAAYLPTRKAAQADPLAALRHS
jgi:putative ABC transport system permease protein